MQFYIKKALTSDSQIISELVARLLLELDPDAQEEINASNLDEVARGLISSGEIIPLLALKDENPIGVLTLHESAAVYAGGLFGTISELYVLPRYRSSAVGKGLILAARQEATDRNWKRLEVGAPGKHEHQKSYTFYLSNGFVEIGTRLRKIL